MGLVIVALEWTSGEAARQVDVDVEMMRRVKLAERAGTSKDAAAGILFG